MKEALGDFYGAPAASLAAIPECRRALKRFPPARECRRLCRRARCGPAAQHRRGGRPRTNDLGSELGSDLRIVHGAEYILEARQRVAKHACALARSEERRV